MRKNLLLLILISLHFYSFGQLTVQPIPQKGSNWCWAACTEMILKFHGSTITQCSLVTLKKRNTYPRKCCSCSGCDTCVTCATCNNCTECHFNNIHTNCDFTMTTLNKFKNLFGELRFDVVKKDNTYSYTNIDTEININRRPLIAMINSGGNCNSSHAGVLRAAFTSSGNNFVVFVNPKLNERMCEAGDEQINIIGGVYSFCNYLTEIRPRASGLIARSISNTQILDNNQSIIQDSSIWDGGIYKTLDNIEFRKLLSRDDIMYTPVRYFSYNNLLETSTESLNINTTAFNEELYEVVNKYPPYVSTTFQLINGKRVPVRLVKLNENPQDFLKEIDNKRKDTPSTDVDNCRLKGYEYIKYPQFAYSFVRFCQGGVYYFVPKGDFRIAKKQLSKGTIYKQSEILSIIKKQTQIDENFYLSDNGSK